jgi:hypothetical protein
VPDELLVATDFNATMYSTDPNSDYAEIEIYILEIDVATKTLQIKFPGAPSGNY